MTYKVDKFKRSHTHRCKACSKIIQEETDIVMIRKAINKTWVLHDECKNKLCDGDNSWLDFFNSWAIERLLKVSSVDYVKKKYINEYNTYLKLNNMKE
jgi:hypothetical protein